MEDGREKQPIGVAWTSKGSGEDNPKDIAEVADRDWFRVAKHGQIWDWPIPYGVWFNTNCK